MWKKGSANSKMAVEFIQSEEQKEKRMKKSADLGLMCIMGLLEGKEKGTDGLFKVLMAEFFPGQEAQRIPNKMNPNTSTPRHITKLP